MVNIVKKSPEEQIRNLLVKHPVPPVEVAIAILKEAGRGEQELTTQLYDGSKAIARGVQAILNLKDSNMKTAARIFEIICVYGGQKIEPLELSDTSFSLRVVDCPMLHVGKDVGKEVKSKFCDLFCSAGSKAIFDAILGPKCTCSWDKKLIKGAGKCTVTFYSGRAK
jgi:hypothetical protein